MVEGDYGKGGKKLEKTKVGKGKKGLLLPVSFLSPKLKAQQPFRIRTDL